MKLLLLLSNKGCRLLALSLWFVLFGASSFLLARPACAGVLIGQGDVGAQSGDHLKLNLTTTAGYYEAAGRVVFYNPSDEVLAEEPKSGFMRQQAHIHHDFSFVWRRSAFDERGPLRNL